MNVYSTVVLLMHTCCHLCRANDPFPASDSYLYLWHWQCVVMRAYRGSSTPYRSHHSSIVVHSENFTTRRAGSRPGGSLLGTIGLPRYHTSFRFQLLVTNDNLARKQRHALNSRTSPLTPHFNFPSGLPPRGGCLLARRRPHPASAIEDIVLYRKQSQGSSRSSATSNR